MPLVIDQLNSVFGVVIRVSNAITTFVGLGVFNPARLSFNARWKIVGTAGVDRFLPVYDEVLKKGVLASHSHPFSCWCGSICALSAKWVLGGVASQYSG
jgi:hypothetical protein